MKHIVQFSGGAASAYVAWLVAKEFGCDDTILLFHDTKTEHPDAYRFRKQISEFIGIPITEASDGRSLWEIIKSHHCLPSSMIPFCTEDLKMFPAAKYYKQLKSINQEFTTYNGLGPEEWRRVQNSQARAAQNGINLRCLLVEQNILDKTVKDIIKNEWRICLPEPYKHLAHNNCIPCFKAGKAHFEKVCRYYPDQFELACLAEEQIGATVFKGKLTLRQLKKKWDRQSSFMEVEESSIPCMCAV